MVKDFSENEPLESIAKRIAECAHQADDKVLEAASLIREARKRVEAGQAGDIKWYPWAEMNIKLSKSRLRELLGIAEADDPKKELERLRGLNNARQTRHRNNNKAKASAPLHNGGNETKVVSEPMEVRTAPPASGATDSKAIEEPERAGLIAWAQEAPIEQVGEVLSFAKNLGPATRDKTAEQAREQVAA